MAVAGPTAEITYQLKRLLRMTFRLGGMQPSVAGCEGALPFGPQPRDGLAELLELLQGFVARVARSCPTSVDSRQFAYEESVMAKSKYGKRYPKAFQHQMVELHRAGPAFLIFRNSSAPPLGDQSVGEAGRS